MQPRVTGLQPPVAGTQPTLSAVQVTITGLQSMLTSLQPMLTGLQPILTGFLQPAASCLGWWRSRSKRKRTTGFDCDDSEVKVVRVRTAEDRVKEAHDNNEVAYLS